MTHRAILTRSGLVLVAALTSYGPVVAGWRGSDPGEAESSISPRPAAASPTGRDRREADPGRLIVILRGLGVPRPRATDLPGHLRLLGATLGLQEVEPLAPAATGGSILAPGDDAYLLEFPATADLEEIARTYRKDPDVRIAQPRYRYRALASPDDPLLGDQWGLRKVRAPEAWDISGGSGAVTVAVLDTGVDPFHPELSGSLVAGESFVPWEPTVDDGHGHGTHVAGIIAATANNGTGIAGLAWSCKVMPLKVLDATGVGYTDWIAAGIRTAADRGARVINMSFGGYAPGAPDPLMKEACEYAAARGVVLVAAAGNSAEDVRDHQPASYPEVIAVGASTGTDTMAGFSNWGEKLEVAAPGEEILSTIPGGFYASWSGTSMASPHVASLAGLIASVNPDLNATDIRRILAESADDILQPGRDLQSGYGRINALQALRAATPQPAPATSTPLLIVSGRVHATGGARPAGLVIEIRNAVRELTATAVVADGGYLAQFIDLNGTPVAGVDEVLEIGVRLPSGDELLVEPSRYQVTGDDIANSIARVTLTVTEQATIDWTLTPGHNLVGLPLARPDGTRFRASEVAKTCQASWLVQVTRDPATGRGRFEAFLPEVGLDDFELDPNRGVLVETTRASTARFSGRPASREAADVDLWPGLNAIAFPVGVRSGLVAIDLAALTGSPFVIRSAATGPAQEGVLEPFDPTLGRPPFAVEWLKGYLISSPAGGTVHLPSREEP